MKRDITSLQKYFKSKRICLLGNADSILKSPKEIDDYDIVCRINKGFPKDKEKYIGKRTDVLFIATYVKSRRIINEYSPNFILWLTPWFHRTSNIVKARAIHVPDENWYELKKILNKKPSSGMMSLYFILKHTSFKQLDIYGFDFFKTGTWYHKAKQRWHDEKKEKKLVETLIKKHNNVRIIYE